MARRARRFGPLPFDFLVELALYHPVLGFYERPGAGAGRAGADFLTSPEVGPLFGATLARALDRWWAELGEPDPFVVVEAGAGRGRLARHVLAARPRCGRALRYLLVERSAALRAHQAEQVALEPAALVLGPVAPGPPDDEVRHLGGTGPLAASLAELPSGPLVGAVVANELLDNLPFRLLERAAGGWAEVRVDADLTEVLVPADAALAEVAEALAAGAAVGSRIPLQQQAAGWLATALAVLERGRVAVIDYADTTGSMARRSWTEWVRTYRAHGPGTPPLEQLGEQDITCEVAEDQLAAVRLPIENRPQHAFLRHHGIDELAEAARRRWRESAPIGDLESLRARSTVEEARALVDPAGLGGFRVLEWAVPQPPAPGPSGQHR